VRREEWRKGGKEEWKRGNGRGRMEEGVPQGKIVA
jgi:hypothetical protein